MGADNAQSAPVPVGLLGLGKHGTRYLEHIRRDVPGLEVVAVSRREVDRGREQARALGVRFHDSVEGLVGDPEVRAIVSVVPPTLNAAVVAACIAEAKPLLIEKPFAPDADTAFGLRDRLEKAGLPCLVAQTLRHSAVVRRVRDWVAEMGSVHQILLSQSFEPSRLDWLDDPRRAGGGNILHTGVHMFDLLRHLGGEVLEASCLLDRVVTQRTEDSFSANFRLRGASGDLLGAAAGSRTTPGRSGSIRIVGEKGQIVADHVLGSLSWIEGRRVTRKEDPGDVPTVRILLEEFVGIARGERSPSITPHDGAAAVAIADACYRSAGAGCRVAVRRE
jgi:predicted dehydrogenase